MIQKHRELMETHIKNYSGMIRSYLEVIDNRIEYILFADLSKVDDETLECIHNGVKEILTRIAKMDSECFELKRDDWNGQKV